MLFSFTCIVFLELCLSFTEASVLVTGQFMKPHQEWDLLERME